jgi:hypothetical protein
MLEHQALQLRDLQSLLAQQERFYQETRERQKHEEDLLQEYRLQLDEASQLLAKRKEEALHRDQQLEHLYRWYSDMTDFLQQIVRCKISMEAEAPHRLHVTFLDPPGRAYWITLEERTGLAVRIDPPSDLHDQMVQKSRALRSLVYLINALRFDCIL